MLKNVRDAIELIYGITQEEYHGGFKHEKETLRRVATILVKRGSLIKTGDRRGATYKWNPIAMKPTKVFFASVAEELMELRRSENRKSFEKRLAKKLENNTEMEQINIEREKQEAGVVVDNPSIRQYTIAELWAEIKRQGGYIQDNRLAVTTYFD